MPDRFAPLPRVGAEASLTTRRFLLRAGLSALVAPALGLPARPARAGLDLLLNEFTATRDELQAELDRRFPMSRRYGELVSVSLHDPQLALDGRTERATLQSRLVILNALLQPSRAGGQLTMSSGLRWDAEGLSVRLQDPRVEQLRIDGVVGSNAQNLERISASVAQDALQGYPLHTFRPQELPLGIQVRDITIHAGGIKVRFQ